MMNQTKYKVSTIIPVYNADKYLKTLEQNRERQRRFREKNKEEDNVNVTLGNDKEDNKDENVKDDEDKREFLDECIKQSIYKIDVVPSINDRILTLSTCTNTGGYSTRWVDQARLKAMKN